MPWVAISRLQEFHDTAQFRCGVESMDKWLQQGMSLQQQGLNAIHVAEGASGNIIGYFALAPHEPYSFQLPRRIRANSRKTPALVLGKLALHVDYRGQQLGPKLLLEALRVAIDAADLIGGRMLVVDARDAKVAEFYKRLNFLPAARLDPLKLYMRINTARRLIGDYDAS